MIILCFMYCLGALIFFCQIAVANYLLYSRSTYWIIVWHNKQVSYKIFFGWKLFFFSVFILHQEQISMLIYTKYKKLKWYWLNCNICKNLWILRKWRFESLSTGYTKHLWCSFWIFPLTHFLNCHHMSIYGYNISQTKGYAYVLFAKKWFERNSNHWA